MQKSDFVKLIISHCSPLVQFSKFNNFLWVCWFLCKNLSSFVYPVWKLHNPYCHNVHCLTMFSLFPRQSWPARCQNNKNAKKTGISNLRSDNLQYNTLVRWVDGTNNSSTKRLMFQAFFSLIGLRALKSLYVFQFL